jgi:hypothetical protein
MPEHPAGVCRLSLPDGDIELPEREQLDEDRRR